MREPARRRYTYSPSFAPSVQGEVGNVHRRPRVTSSKKTGPSSGGVELEGNQVGGHTRTHSRVVLRRLGAASVGWWARWRGFLAQGAAVEASGSRIP